MTDGVTKVAVTYEERNPFVERVTILPDGTTIEVSHRQTSKRLILLSGPRSRSLGFKRNERTWCEARERLPLSSPCLRVSAP